MELGPGVDPLTPAELERVLGKKVDYDYHSMDYYTSTQKGKATYWHDLDVIPWKVVKKKFDIVYASHILEHVKDLGDVLDEIYRHMNKSGTLVVRMPHGSTGYAWGHPTHHRMASCHTFDYFGDYPEKYCQEKGFHVVSRKLIYSRLWVFGKFITWLSNYSPKWQHIFERFLFGYIGGFDEMIFVLKRID